MTVLPGKEGKAYYVAVFGKGQCVLDSELSKQCFFAFKQRLSAGGAPEILVSETRRLAGRILYKRMTLGKIEVVFEVLKLAVGRKALVFVLHAQIYMGYR